MSTPGVPAPSDHYLALARARREAAGPVTPLTASQERTLARVFEGLAR